MIYLEWAQFSKNKVTYELKHSKSKLENENWCEKKAWFLFHHKLDTMLQESSFEMEEALLFIQKFKIT